MKLIYLEKTLQDLSSLGHDVAPLIISGEGREIVKTKTRYLVL